MSRVFRCLVLASTVALSAQGKPLTLSVLYFDNNTGRADFEPMKKGLADMLSGDLSTLPGVTVVERERLQALLDEQKVSNSKFFDPATAAKTGRLLGASHVVTGAMAAFEPQVRLDVRLIEVSTGTVLVTSQVVGSPENFFQLEQDLVRQFAKGLALKAGTLVPNGATVKALLAYSRGVDAADQGDLEGARAPLTSAVQAAPQFELARRKYSQLLAKLEDAKQRRTTLLGDDEQVLQAHIAEWTKVPLTSVRGEQQSFVVGYHLAGLELGALHARALVKPDGRSDGWPYVVRPQIREELARIETATINDALQLASLLEPFPDGLRPSLPDEDRERLRVLVNSSDELFDHSGETQASAVVTIAARWALLGRLGGHVTYRPSLAQLDPAIVDRALAWLELANRGKNKFDRDGERVVNIAAEGLLLVGQRERAVALWQRFLDDHPRAEGFQRVQKQIERALLVSPDLALGLKAVETCDGSSLDKMQLLLPAVAQAEGVAGLKRLLSRVEACNPKRVPQGWRLSAYYATATLALELGDCELLRSVRKRCAALGPNYDSSFNLYESHCEPAK